MTGDDVIDVPGADPVDSGTTDPRHRRGGRGRRTVLTGLAVVAVLAVALAAMAALAIGPFSTRDAGTISFDAVRTGYGRDGDRILVVGFLGADPSRSERDGCWEGYLAEATGHPTKVDVALHRRKASRFATFRHDEVDCYRDLRARTTSVGLPDPLADRSVVDVDGGAAMEVFDGPSLLRPDPMPVGWREQTEGGFMTAAGPAWSRTFGPGDPTDSEVVDVTQGPAAHPVGTEGMRLDGRPEVRGTTAEYYERDGQSMLTWVEGDQHVLLTSGSGSEPLTEAELVAFAESLVPEG